ncbi:MAG: hypothetical protein Q9196_007332 [Gyalolechia fulgens]
MAEDNKWRPPGDEDDDEEVDETAYKSVKDAVLFVIEIPREQTEIVRRQLH